MGATSSAKPRHASVGAVQTRPARQSNIELLRIVAMLMIIGHHFVVHGAFDFPTDAITFNRLWTQLIQIGGKIGVDIFVLISGYFLVTAKGLKVDKVLKLWLQLVTYSVVIFLIFVRLGIVEFDRREFVHQFFPITYPRWWFAAAYFVLYLMSPYLNLLLTSLSKRRYQSMLLLFGFLWCILPTFTGQGLQSNSLWWFVYLYALAGYMRLWKPRFKAHGLVYIALAVVLIGLTFLTAVGYDILGMQDPSYAKRATFYYEMQQLPILAISVLMFVGFLKLDLGYRRIINLVSAATFGVYLIHDHPFVSSLLWLTIFKNASYAGRRILAPYSIVVILAVFVVCTAIELVRIHVLERAYMGGVKCLSQAVDNRLEQLGFGE